MPGKIFVNYRRDDVPDGAARLRDGLAAKFGKANVFMDVDNLLVGQRFDVELAKALDDCDMLIAVIGPRWMDLLKERTASGERDYVREEIAAALRRGLPQSSEEELRRGLPRSSEQGAARKITVVPVRVGREGSMPALPRRDDLPEDIRDLVLHQKLDVAHERFGRDMAELIEGIIAVRRSMNPPRPSVTGTVPWGWVGATAASVLAIAYVGAYQLGVPVWVPWSQSPSPLQPTREQLEAAARQSALQEQEAKRVAAEQREKAAEQKAADDARAQKAAADATEAKRRSEEAERQRAAAAEAKRVADAAAAKKAQDDEAERQRVAAEQRERQAAEQRQREAAAKKAEDDRRRVAAEQRKQEEAAAAMQPGRVFRDCNDGCPDMVVVPAGTFMMGEGSSQRRTSIAQSFAVGKFEVTFAEWEACVAGGGCTSNKSPSDQGWGKGRRPVINVSWNDAKEYVSWISRKTGKTYRLLTKAEWEYAARAGTTTRYSWGDDIGKGNANCAGCGSQWEYKQTAPAGSFKANPWGLHDMHGNVWEWCEDTYNSFRVAGGGSWYLDPVNFGSSLSALFDPVGRWDKVGFRVARVLSPARTL